MTNQKKIFLGLLIVVTAAVIYLVKDYFGVIALSVLVVLMFNPIYKRTLSKTNGKKGLALAWVMLVILLSFIVPIAIIGSITANQVSQVARDLEGSNFTSSDIGRITNDSLGQINSLLRSNSINYEITQEDLNNALNPALRSGGTYLLDLGRRVGSNVPQYITDVILFFVLLGFFFTTQSGLLAAFRKISPLSDEINKIYLNRMAAMARSMINGTFVVAFVQAVIGTLTLLVTGVPYVLFFFLVLLVASIIPLLGSGLVLIPISIVMIATGNIVGGIIVLLVQFLIISNIDNVLRPKLVEEDAKLPEAITLLGIIAGLSLFGILGLIFGPVIMVIAYTTYEIYLKYYAISVKNYLNQA